MFHTYVHEGTLLYFNSGDHTVCVMCVCVCVCVCVVCVCVSINVRLYVCVACH